MIGGTLSFKNGLPRGSTDPLYASVPDAFSLRSLGARIVSGGNDALLFRFRKAVVVLAETHA
ncbi:MAG: hypothetical protein ABEL51_00275, partial [Salinibacter sp.]